MRARARGPHAGRIARWSGAALGVVAVLGAGLFAAGPAGVVIVASLVGLLGVLWVWSVWPRPPAGPARQSRARTSRGRPDGAAGPEFAAYRDIRGRLAWAGAGMRHFDTSARPLLYRLFTAVAADRSGLDVDRDRDAARRLLGPDLWPLLDPDRPACTDSDAPGVGPATLTRIVDRLEEL